ncbi:MAG: hypothetical protein ABFD76_04075 [Smithella sp.]|jgi:hypothetical protein
MAAISQAWAYFSAIDLLGKKSASANARSITAKDTIISKIRETDPKNADALEKQLNDNKQVIAQLRNSKVYGAQSSKAAAAEKLKRIKAEIQMLKTMGGDPRIVAKQIARLAKELAVAAREYASVSGTTSPEQAVSTDAVTNTSGSDVAALNTAAGGTTDSGAAVSASVSATAGSGETSAPEEKDKKVDGVTQGQDSASTTTTGAALAEGARQYQETQRQKFKDDLQEQGAKIMKKTLEAFADREFANDVSVVAARLKAMAGQIKQRLHEKGDHKADQDISQTNQALTEVEKSVTAITGPNQGIMANGYV